MVALHVFVLVHDVDSDDRAVLETTSAEPPLCTTCTTFPVGAPFFAGCAANPKSSDPTRPAPDAIPAPAGATVSTPMSENPAYDGEVAVTTMATAPRARLAEHDARAAPTV